MFDKVCMHIKYLLPIMSVSGNGTVMVQFLGQEVDTFCQFLLATFKKMPNFISGELEVVHFDLL